MSGRNIQLDELKGIGILLVMIGHAIPQTGFAHNLIYGFHMSLFFFCSGVFFKDKPLKDGILKDVKTLMIPWVTFSVFLVLCSLLLKIASDGEGPMFRPLDEDCYILYYTIWFLPCLFLTRTFYRIIDLIRNKVAISLLCWGGTLLLMLCDSVELTSRSLSIVR